jgi:hypothetical protein
MTVFCKKFRGYFSLPQPLTSRYIEDHNTMRMHVRGMVITYMTAGNVEKIQM